MKKLNGIMSRAYAAVTTKAMEVQGPVCLNSKWTQRVFTLLVMGFVTFLAAGGAQAITAPASGSLFYDAYDIVVNSMLKGAVGFVASILIFAMAIGLFFMQKIIPGVVSIVCAALLVKADAIVTSLGATF